MPKTAASDAAGPVVSSDWLLQLIPARLQPLQQPREPVLGPIVAHRQGQRLLLPDEDPKFPIPGDYGPTVRRKNRELVPLIELVKRQSRFVGVLSKSCSLSHFPALRLSRD